MILNLVMGKDTNDPLYNHGYIHYLLFLGQCIPINPSLSCSPSLISQAYFLFAETYLYVYLKPPKI